MVFNINTTKLIEYGQAFEEVCFDALIKISFIKKLPNGKWQVVSIKGKPLGTYKTKEEAVKRLRQIEFFKHKKASKEEDFNPASYSSIVRFLRKNYDDGVVEKFQKCFKEKFDAEILSGNNEPEEDCLKEALKVVSKKDDLIAIKKFGTAIDLGNPESAGKYLANLFRFMMKRISQERRQKSIDNLKNKIYFLNEFDMAGKKAPNSAAIGNSIAILKTLLLEQKPQYIRAVLNSTVRHL
jgi:flagellin-specific chaperone FliS